MTVETIYVLCAVTSLFCFGLLFRGYLRMRTPILLWSSAAFLLLTISNFLLVLDLMILPNVNLLLFRNLVTLIGVVLLICGLILNA